VSNYSSNGSGWLTVSPSSGTNLAVGSPTTVTVTATPPATNGTYTAQVTFSGHSYPSGQNINANALPSPITVTLVVSGAPVTPTSTVTGITVSCPSGLNTSQTSTCSATVSGTGGYSPVVTWTTSGGSFKTPTSTSGAGDGYTAPGTAGTVTITACSAQAGYTTVCKSTTITITQPLPTCTPGDPSCQATCTLTASPSSIVVPETSTLQYSCTNVTQCTLSGGQFDGGQSVAVDSTTQTANGSVTIDPASTTTYTLSCANVGNYSNTDTTTIPTTITVGGTGLCETNPNGAGCPGQ
jgi:hypothetical protein